jgi:hypothetical protein
VSVDVRTWSRPRQRAAWVAGALLGLLLLVGVYYLTTLAHNGGGLGQREVVVVFAPAASQEQHASVLKICGHVRNATPEPMGSAKQLSARVSNVRFRIDRASDADVAQLLTCVQAQPGVVGFDVPSQM